MKGDLFVIRSSEDTLGGGKVVDPHPARRHRRYVEATIQRLMAMGEGLGRMRCSTSWSTRAPVTSTPCPSGPTCPRLKPLPGPWSWHRKVSWCCWGMAPPSANPWCTQTGAWEALRGKVSQALLSYHRQHPLHKGISREELRSRLGLSSQTLPRVLRRLAEQGDLVEGGAHVGLPNHSVTLNASQQRQVDDYVRALESEPYSPPTDRSLDPELLALLIDEGKVVKVNETVVFGSTAFKDMVEKIVAHAREQGKITVAEGRNLFGTSRKYMLPLLEYLDQQHVTRRVGDERVLR